VQSATAQAAGQWHVSTAGARGRREEGSRPQAARDPPRRRPSFCCAGNTHLWLPHPSLRAHKMADEKMTLKVDIPEPEERTSAMMSGKNHISMRRFDKQTREILQKFDDNEGE
jgi:hypothetical protein